MRKVKKYKGWTIYQDGEDFYVFLPEESPHTMDSPEWEGGSIQEMIDFIDSY